ncbi:MAG TPA: hypothetical protein VFE15_09060 [Marmoricola sp.]|jgi:hypothetical protein|nr:hypothetical protein [Marmoricola sp.]
MSEDTFAAPGAADEPVRAEPPAYGAGTFGQPGQLAMPTAGPADGPRKTADRLALLTDLSVVVAWFAVAAVIAAVIWVQVTPLPEFTRTADNGTMGEDQLVKQFATNGWFLVIAAVGGLASGFALLLVRRRRPIAMVLLVAAGGALATIIMLQVGLALGPDSPSTTLAKVKVGGTVPVQLKPDVHAVYLVWSITALVGAVLALWGRESAAGSDERVEPL